MEKDQPEYDWSVIRQTEVTVTASLSRMTSQLVIRFN